MSKTESDYISIIKTSFDMYVLLIYYVCGTLSCGTQTAEYGTQTYV